MFMHLHQATRGGSGKRQVRGTKVPSTSRVNHKVGNWLNENRPWLVGVAAIQRI